MENGMMNGDHDRSRSPSPGLVRSNSRNASSKEINRTSLLRRNQSLSAKQIRFYRNGDRFFCGLKLAVSPERYKEFDALLAELSNKLELSTGAVRYIFNAETGQMITDVNELQYGASYVCSSTNVFKEVDAGYGNMKPSWSLAHHKKEAPPTSSSVHLIDGTRDFIKPKLVTVIKNGKPPQKKVTMLLNAKTAINLEQVLDHLSSKGTLGKVDKLHTVDGKQIRELRHLFGDDTMFVALQSNEKFPDEGFDVDVQSYKITPYRDLKRPAGLKRSSSLRTPRGRRDSGSNDTGGSHTPSRDRQVRRSASVKSAGKERGMSPGPPARVNGHSPRATSAKSPNGSSGRRTPNSSYAHPNEELYPAHVFEKESPDSAWRKGTPKKVIRKPKTKTNPPSSDKFYSTVWLSDYESEPDKKLELMGNRGTIALSSHATTPYSSRPTSPLSSQASSPFSSRPNTPSLFSKFEDEDSGLHSEIDKSYDEAIGLRKKLHRTLSLPDAELNQLCAKDLQDRFTTLQLEQENRELKKLTVELQAALEKLEERVNCLRSIEHDSLDEASSLAETHPHISEIHIDSKVSVEDYHYDHKIPQSNELPQTLRKRSKSDADLLLRRKNKSKDTTTCCVS